MLYDCTLMEKKKRLYPTSFSRDALYLYDFDLSKKKNAKKARGDSLQKIGVIPYWLYDMLRHNFP